jgi:hypothetical protein
MDPNPGGLTVRALYEVEIVDGYHAGCHRLLQMGIPAHELEKLADHYWRGHTTVDPYDLEILVNSCKIISRIK